MESKPKGAKTISNLLSKTVGLIFFSFLAISLGVVFGLLFDGWVKDQPGTPVGSETSNLQTMELPSEKLSSPGDTIENTTEKSSGDLSGGADGLTKPAADNTTLKPAAAVRYKVRVGPYADRTQALAASTQLQSLGYPVYVGNNPPFAVQVGAFATQANADKLKAELAGKGYKVFVEKSQ